MQYFYLNPTSQEEKENASQQEKDKDERLPDVLMNLREEREELLERLQQLREQHERLEESVRYLKLNFQRWSRQIRDFQKQRKRE